LRPGRRLASRRSDSGSDFALGRAEREGRGGAAPGVLAPASVEEVRTEVARARRTYHSLGVAEQLVLVEPDGAEPGCDRALDALLGFLSVEAAEALAVASAGPERSEAAARQFDLWKAGQYSPQGSAGKTRLPDPAARQRRQVEQAVQYTQRLLGTSARRRDAFWSAADATSPDAWQRSTERYRSYLWDEVLGRCPPPSVPHDPHTQLVYDRPRWTGYEVRLDVWPDVFASGLLLIPKGIAPGERRPVVADPATWWTSRIPPIATSPPDWPIAATWSMLRRIPTSAAMPSAALSAKRTCSAGRSTPSSWPSTR